MNRISKTFTGHCPYQDCDETIRVDYLQINMSHIRGIKKTGLKCEYASINGCPDPNNCPIYLSAPEG